VLQEREFERLGGSRTVKVDVRIVAATNRDLAADVAAGRFRNDLFYRLNVFPVHVPALREHPDDIAPLVAHFTAKYAARFRRPVTRVNPQTLRELMTHDWPGNVRELEHVIERGVIVSTGSTLQLERDVPAGGRGVSPLADQVTASERAAIETALASSRGRVSGPRGAARQLDMPASTLEFRIRKLGIDKFRFRRELR
jgi:formate hydrogenlyase transcriptional activator